MLVKLDYPKLLSDGISIISDLVTEAKLKFDSSGMNVVAIDPANVALVSFKLPSHAFSQFEVNNERKARQIDLIVYILKNLGLKEK